ncbi:hypothetical protein TREES_T100020468 [Tupaia chinensis]|uniref:Uncharacterized protein n=1 Tax=Tupaia chinensis TaxID=246437 RepID=L9L0V2_TUPCH|nr:hypothetical protein TREES_T100020468 [Tupaia chinensis]
MYSWGVCAPASRMGLGHAIVLSPASPPRRGWDMDLHPSMLLPPIWSGLDTHLHPSVLLPTLAGLDTHLHPACSSPPSGLDTHLYPSVLLPIRSGLDTHLHPSVFPNCQARIRTRSAVGSGCPHAALVALLGPHARPPSLRFPHFPMSARKDIPGKLGAGGTAGPQRHPPPATLADTDTALSKVLVSRPFRNGPASCQRRSRTG